MNRVLRSFGFGLILLGVVLLVVWAVEPLRAIWPWLLRLPLAIRVGVLASTIGVAVLLASMISERIRERDADKHLLDEP